MEDQELELGPLEAKVQAAVRDLPEVQPDPAFRARLAREFASGRIMERPAAVPGPRPAWHAAVRWGYIPAAAAVLLVAVLIQNRGPDWTLIQVSKSGTATVAGQTVDLASGVSGKMLHGGSEMSLSPEAGVTLLDPEVVIVQATPGSSFRIPSTPGRWFGKTIHADLAQGELRFMTGPEFPGHRLEVHTPEGVTEITGTVVSVWRDGTTTCVCVLKGTAMIGTGPGDMQPVPAGMRKVMFGDGQAPMVSEIEPHHKAGLVPFVDRNEAYFEE